MAGRSRLILLGMAILGLVNGGCLAVAAGAAAAGAGAAGYAYVKGRYYRDYAAPLDYAFAGIRTALLELQFAIVHEEKAGGKAMIESRTTAGSEVRVDFETLVSSIPAEGQLTRISIRVGTFGDELVSARIFDQADLHFVPRASAPRAMPTTMTPPVPPAPPSPVVAATGTARPFETAPPPLAAAPPTPPAAVGTSTAPAAGK